MPTRIVSHRQLKVYQNAFEASMRIFEVTKEFPREERYSLTDQIRRASRSVSTSITEAWRKRRYEAAFVSKLNDAEGEAAEVQCWIEYAVRCGYARPADARPLYREYHAILSTLVGMIRNADKWILPDSPKEARTRKTQT